MMSTMSEEHVCSGLTDDQFERWDGWIFYTETCKLNADNFYGSESQDRHCYNTMVPKKIE